MRIGKVNRTTKETNVIVELILDRTESLNSEANMIVYREGDGDELICDYDEDDTIKIVGNSYAVTTSGDDVIFTVGESKVTLKGARNKSIKICDDDNNIEDIICPYIYGGSDEDKLFGGGSYNPPLYSYNQYSTVVGGSSDDHIYYPNRQRIFSRVEISSGIGFFDHMLNLFAAHGKFGLKVICKGDLEVDGHHSVEDIGIALGAALKEALGDKRGIARYGTFFLPMDETLALVSLDISGRPFLVCELGELAPTIGGFDTELVEEFLRAFAFNAGITLHVKILYGKNSHHKVEAIFKALGHALRAAVTVDKKNKDVPSTKGVL